jgi:heme/copper-type cytochrome/quinol oxidase subunit 2
MFGVSIACVVVGFLAGTYLVYRFVPPLAATREGIIALWVVRTLVGVALSWAVLQVYFGIYAFVNYPDAGRFMPPVPSGSRAEILTSTLEPIFLLSGLLTAAATVIYLLAPVREIADDD